MIQSKAKSYWLAIFLLLPLLGFTQEKRSFFAPSDTLDKTRLLATEIFTGTAYVGFSIALWEAWYKDYPLTRFHLFNDLGEWEDMDKVGHLLSANLQANISFDRLLWTGLDRRKSMWIAAGVGTIIQGTFEVMDGFSENWGFSLADIAYNTAGVGLFVAQEMAWQEQRIVMKISASKPNYPEYTVFSIDGGDQMLITDRIADLYGTGFFESFIKDYNGQTTWASFNINAFTNKNGQSKVPDWLNVAVGYGAENMFGGFGNTWENENGATFILDDAAFPRYRQFYLSLDVDLTRIKTKSHFLKTVFTLFNWIKIPAPALEVNTQGGFKFHPIHY